MRYKVINTEETVTKVTNCTIVDDLLTEVSVFKTN